RAKRHNHPAGVWDRNEPVRLLRLPSGRAVRIDDAVPIRIATARIFDLNAAWNTGPFVDVPTNLAALRGRAIVAAGEKCGLIVLIRRRAWWEYGNGVCLCIKVAR